MDRVSAQFHKNVLLLTKFVTPHDELKKQFKENMFDKPNTAGFIHVSYYLLNVYYKDNVKTRVQWPVICKQTENKFRSDVRECLMAISNENLDVNFPPIFASHLLLARGTKFLIIMWKFSLVVLRTYLAREHQTIISITPKPGPCQELTKTFLKNVVYNHGNVVSSIRKEREAEEQKAKDFLRKKSQDQNHLKAKILEMREDLKEITFNAPVNATAKKRLLNVEDSEIINMWTSFINDNLMSKFEKDYESLKNIDDLLKSISNIVLNLAGNSQTLNALNLDRINIDPIYKLVPPEKQVLPYNLYNKENLNLLNLFSIFNILIKKFENNFKKNQLGDFSNCIIQLNVSNKDLKTAINHFQNLHEQIVSFTLEKLKKNDELNESHKIISNILECGKVLFMPSPSIQINNYYEEGRNVYQNHLKLTPVEGAYKELFSRHALNGKGSYSTKKKHLSAQRINFDDSTYDTSNDKQSVAQRFHSPLKPRSTLKNVAKYSRIFSSRKLNDSRVNNSVMMMMSSTGNSMLPLMTKQPCISLIDSCNSSQEFSQEPLLLNPNLNSTIESLKSEGDKVTQRSSKRRSIGDLVERYKNLIQKRDTNSQVTNVPTRETLGEETAI